MDRDEVLNALQAAGTEQTRKTLARHGVVGKQFGVSYAFFKTLAKKIKTDHELAGKLWDSGVHDARVLALMIADPARATAKQIDLWARDVTYHVLAGAFASFVGRTPFAQDRAEKWQASKDEWLCSAGWGVLAHLAGNSSDLSDDYFAKKLMEIERTIGGSKNRVRYEMNNALISIGTRSTRLTEFALAAAKRIGKVDVDHGETGCKTPDAAEYIHKTLAHRASKKK